MKGIVLGKGFLGQRISEFLGFQLSDFKVSDPKNLDLFLKSEKPQILINAIGKTGGPGAIGIDWCETHKEETWFANVSVPAMLAKACKENQVYLVHLSSGCVYYGDNQGKGYSEQDEPNFYGPQYYAITKIEAQKALSEFPVLQLRIRMPIDDKPHPRNLIDKLKGYSKVIDIQNSMTTVPHMLDALKILIEKRATGIYNLTNPGTISAREIMQLYRDIVDPNHKFEIMTLGELDKATVGKRSNCMLDTSKLKAEGIEMPEIHEAVRECLQSYRRHR